MHEAMAVVGLALLLGVVVSRPRRLPEAAVGVPVAALLIALHAVPWADARSELHRLAPVVGFLAAVLVLAAGCAGEGLFAASGAWMARAARRSPSRLLVVVVGLSAAVTATLSLDTTVILLTPVVVVAVRETGVLPRPSLYATAHLANTGSLLLPVSNLTNLLAVTTMTLSFGRFAALMALPWLVGIAVELVGTRLVFGADLAPAGTTGRSAPQRVPRFAAVVVALTVAGFAVASLFGVQPVWVATAGAVVLTARRLVGRRTRPVDVVRSVSVSFCLWVLALGVVVRAVSDDGLQDVVRHAVPGGSGLLTLLAVAGVAALLANVVNNLPAILVLLPLTLAGGVPDVLAMLLGVNIGPNLTYTGSLATLLWRRIVRGTPGVPDLADFTRYGAVTVPLALIGATVALWVSLRVIGT